MINKKKLGKQQIRFLEGIKAMRSLLIVLQATSGRSPMSHQGHPAHEFPPNVHRQPQNSACLTPHTHPTLWSVHSAAVFQMKSRLIKAYFPACFQKRKQKRENRYPS